MLHVSLSYREREETFYTPTCSRSFAISKAFGRGLSGVRVQPAAGGRGFENQVPKLGALQYLHRLLHSPNTIGSLFLSSYNGDCRGPALII